MRCPRQCNCRRGSQQQFSHLIISVAWRYWPARPHFQHDSHTMAAGYLARLSDPLGVWRGKRSSLGFRIAFHARSRQSVRLMRTTRLRSGPSFWLALSEPRTPPGRNGPGGVPYGAGRRSLIRRQVKDKLVLFTRLCIELHTPSTGIHGPPRAQTPYSQLGEALSKGE